MNLKYLTPKITEAHQNDTSHNYITFDQILQDEKIYVIDFYADWCGPCKYMSPVFESIAQESQSSDVVFVKVDTDQNQAISAEFEITSIPTFIVGLTKSGDFLVAGQIIGGKDPLTFKKELDSMIQIALKEYNKGDSKKDSSESEGSTESSPSEGEE